METPTHAPVYIAAPFAARRETSVVENVRRAVALATLAPPLALTPVLVHLNVDRGIYGSDDDPIERAAGLAATRALAYVVGQAGGQIWVLVADDGSLSIGCAGELEAFRLGYAEYDEHGYARTGFYGTVAPVETRITFFRWTSGKPERCEDNFVPAAHGNASEDSRPTER